MKPFLYYAYKEGQKLCSSMRMIILVGVALFRSFDSTGLRVMLISNCSIRTDATKAMCFNKALVVDLFSLTNLWGV